MFNLKEKLRELPVGLAYSTMAAVPVLLIAGVLFDFRPYTSFELFQLFFIAAIYLEITE